MRAEAVAAGLAVTIDSAGTGGWHIGNPPDPRAIAEAEAEARGEAEATSGATPREPSGAE